jgi:hypothetical protein
MKKTSYGRKQRAALLPAMLGVVLTFVLVLGLPAPLAAQDGDQPPVTDPVAAPDTSTAESTADPARSEEVIAGADSEAAEAEEVPLDAAWIAETGATCPTHGMQEFSFNGSKATTATQPPGPPASGLQAGYTVAPTGPHFAQWALIKFSYDRSSLPARSEICSSSISIAKRGGAGAFSPVVNYMNFDWSVPTSWAAVQGGPGPQLATSLSFDARGPAQTWLNGALNHGIVVQSSNRSATNYAALGNPTLKVTVHCDFKAPTSNMKDPGKSVEGLSPAARWPFDVKWEGADQANDDRRCNKTGIDKYHVEYRMAAPGEGGAQASWASYYVGGSTSKLFDHHVADGTKVDFRVYAVDHAGNAQSCCERTVTTYVDRNPPQSHFDPPLQEYTYASNFEVRWRAIDLVSGPKSCKVRYQVDGKGWQEKGGELIGQPSPYEKIFRHSVFGAQHNQFYEFQITCRDNVDNTSATMNASTRISLYPDASMGNITPNYVPDQAPFQLAWNGISHGSAAITGFHVYYRMHGETQWVQHRDFPGETRSGIFPFDGTTPAPGLWEFQTTASNDKGETTPLVEKPEATVVVGAQGGSGGFVYLPRVMR